MLEITNCRLEEFSNALREECQSIHQEFIRSLVLNISGRVQAHFLELKGDLQSINFEAGMVKISVSLFSWIWKILLHYSVIVILYLSVKEFFSFSTLY